MYAVILLLHSWLRWAVVAAALFAIARAVLGLTGRRPWVSTDFRAGRLFVTALDIQFTLGLVLYFLLSPITKGAMSDFGTAMKVSAVRFWAVEHAAGMLIGVALAHVGWARQRRIVEPRRKHRTAAIFFVLALVVILASIPWPGTPNARPLFRW